MKQQPNVASSKSFWLYAVLLVLTGGLFCVDVVHGAVNIPMKEVWHILVGDHHETSHSFIVTEFRLPKAITAICAGAAVSLAGLIMQTFFRNPLAGPFVLGISSGASLGVALLVMAGSYFTFLLGLGQWAVSVASLLGSALVLVLVMVASKKVTDGTSLLIIGLMFGSFSSAIVSILQFFSLPELIQSYLFWTFGSLSGVGWQQLGILVPAVFIGLILSIALQKNLNLLLLGENYAKTMGMNIRLTRYLVIFATCLLAGVVTAFCGPIAFLGMAVPHFARNLFRTSDHRKLIPACVLLGAILLLGCDILTQIPGKDLTLPINALTSLIGAPAVVAIILQRRKIMQ